MRTTVPGGPVGDQDHPRLRFGLALDFGTERTTLDRLLDEYIPLVEMAEELGFESVWAGENYPFGPGRFHLPSPLIVLAALARSTRMRLGTGVTLVPVWHPLKLAYDAAVLDQITGGRLVLGVGVGNPPDWKRFDVQSFDVGRRLDEMLRAIRALWHGESGYQGDLIRIEGGIAPLPLQPGGPPLLVGGRTGGAVRRAADLGEGWYAATAYSLREIARQSERYRDALAREGMSRPRVAINRLTAVAENDVRAMTEARPYVASVLHKYARIGQFRDASGNPNVGDEPPAEAWTEQICLIGSPDTVAGQLQRYVLVGVTDVQFRVAPGDMPASMVARTIRLVGTEVIPRFAEARA